MYWKFFIKQLKLELEAVQPIYKHKITNFGLVGLLTIEVVDIFNQDVSVFQVLK